MISGRNIGSQHDPLPNLPRNHKLQQGRPRCLPIRGSTLPCGQKPVTSQHSTVNWVPKKSSAAQNGVNVSITTGKNQTNNTLQYWCLCLICNKKDSHSNKHHLIWMVREWPKPYCNSMLQTRAYPTRPCVLDMPTLWRTATNGRVQGIPIWYTENTVRKSNTTVGTDILNSSFRMQITKNITLNKMCFLKFL